MRLAPLLLAGSLASCTLLYTETAKPDKAPAVKPSEAPLEGVSIPTPFGTVTIYGFVGVALLAALVAWWLWEKRKARAVGE